MKILFSPSEGKKSGGTLPPFRCDTLLFAECADARCEAAKHYNDFVVSADEARLGALFGIKDSETIARYRRDVFTQPTMKAIERYDGVAYDHLDYASLGDAAKACIDGNVVIFSNLFGPVSAADPLPEYKFKQGKRIGTFIPEKHYKQACSQALDTWLGDAPFLDLRAGFYDKFYKPSSPYVTLKFLKNGKAVSHWAKAYRGKVLRVAAQESVQTTDALLRLEIEGLRLVEILQKGLETEAVYAIETE